MKRKLLFLVLLLLGVTQIKASVDKRAVWCENKETLYMIYEESPAVGSTLEGTDGAIVTKVYSISTTYGLQLTDDNVRTNIKKVVFMESFKNVQYNYIFGGPEPDFSWFMKMGNLEEIEHIDYVPHTDKVKSMYRAFYNCAKLKSIDLSSLNTSNVTTMKEMFSGCKALETITFGENFKTDNVTTMQEMFSGCNSLTSLDVSSFKTGNVTDMFAMFSGCRVLTSLDLTNFDTQKVTNMFKMFDGCYALTSLDVSHFNTSLVTDMERMFCGCKSLTVIDVSNFDTSNVTSISYMFSSSVSSSDNMAVKTIFVGTGWSTDKVTNSTDTFKGCMSLHGEYGWRYDPNYSTHKRYAHTEPTTENPVSSYDTNTYGGCLTKKSVKLTANPNDGAYWATYYNKWTDGTVDDNTTIYTAELSSDKSKLILHEQTGKLIPAGNAVILKSTAATITVTRSEATENVWAANSLTGVQAETTKPTVCYVLGENSSGTLGFYNYNGTKVGAQKVYLVLPTTARGFIGFEKDSETTEIEAVPTDFEEVLSGEFYDLSGRRVEGQLKKGIYVSEGKIIIIK